MGMIWGPDRGSYIEKIISICNDLKNVTKGKQKKIENLSKSIDELLVETQQ